MEDFQSIYAQSNHELNISKLNVYIWVGMITVFLSRMCRLLYLVPWVMSVLTMDCEVKWCHLVAMVNPP